jgi:hypothetical protein
VSISKQIISFKFFIGNILFTCPGISLYDKANYGAIVKYYGLQHKKTIIPRRGEAIGFRFPTEWLFIKFYSIVIPAQAGIQGKNGGVRPTFTIFVQMIILY